MNRISLAPVIQKQLKNNNNSIENNKIVTKKKILIFRPCLTEDEIEEIKQAFHLFNTEGTGKVDPRRLKSAIQSLGFDQKKTKQLFYTLIFIQQQLHNDQKQIYKLIQK